MGGAERNPTDYQDVGLRFAHWCQLNLKASLEQVFGRLPPYLVPSLRLGMSLIEAPPP
ncbi:MAG: hypothetical protein V7L05_02195 [Nostoc sp.]